MLPNRSALGANRVRLLIMAHDRELSSLRERERERETILLCCTGSLDADATVSPIMDDRECPILFARISFCFPLVKVKLNVFKKVFTVSHSSSGSGNGSICRHRRLRCCR